MRNWFKTIKRKKIYPNPKSITEGEYKLLLGAITPEKGLKHYSLGEKRVRNLYRPWLANGIKLGFETGRRREEIINLI